LDLGTAGDVMKWPGTIFSTYMAGFVFIEPCQFRNLLLVVQPYQIDRLFWFFGVGFSRIQEEWT
jgi:hypothetical protein